MYERRRNIRKFIHPSFEENIEEVFGERWILVWLWPFTESPPKGDGVHFTVYPDVKERKTN